VEYTKGLDLFSLACALRRLVKLERVRIFEEWWDLGMEKDDMDPPELINALSMQLGPIREGVVWEVG